MLLDVDVLLVVVVVVVVVAEVVVGLLLLLLLPPPLPFASAVSDVVVLFTADNVPVAADDAGLLPGPVKLAVAGSALSAEVQMDRLAAVMEAEEVAGAAWSLAADEGREEAGLDARDDVCEAVCDSLIGSSRLFSRVGFNTYGNAGLVRSIFKSESTEDVCLGGIIIRKGGTFSEDDDDEDDDDDERVSLSAFNMNLSFSDLVGEEARDPSDLPDSPVRCSSVRGEERSSHLPVTGAGRSTTEDSVLGSLELLLPEFLRNEEVFELLLESGVCISTCILFVVPELSMLLWEQVLDDERDEDNCERSDGGKSELDDEQVRVFNLDCDAVVAVVIVSNSLTCGMQLDRMGTDTACLSISGMFVSSSASLISSNCGVNGSIEWDDDDTSSP